MLGSEAQYLPEGLVSGGNDCRHRYCSYSHWRTRCRQVSTSIALGLVVVAQRMRMLHIFACNKGAAQTTNSTDGASQRAENTSLWLFPRYGKYNSEDAVRRQVLTLTPWSHKSNCMTAIQAGLKANVQYRILYATRVYVHEGIHTTIRQGQAHKTSFFMPVPFLVPASRTAIETYTVLQGMLIIIAKCLTS